MDGGFFPIYRKFFEHELWKEKRVFSRAEAWLDLLQAARHDPTPTTILIGNNSIEIRRGEVPAAVRFLAQRWGWGKTKADNYLNYLKYEGMIKTRTAERTKQTIISICNYDNYNWIPDKERTIARTMSGQRADSSETNKNKDNNYKNENSMGETPPPIKNEEYDNFLKRYRKFNTWLSKNAPRVLKMEEPMNADQFGALLAEYSIEEITRVMQRMHNHRPLFSKYISAYQTAKNWIDDDRKKAQEHDKSKDDSRNLSHNDRKYGSTEETEADIIAEAIGIDSRRAK